MSNFAIFHRFSLYKFPEILRRFTTKGAMNHSLIENWTADRARGLSIVRWVGHTRRWLSELTILKRLYQYYVNQGTVQTVSINIPVKRS